MNKILEVCCGNYYDALQASLGGATRIELNSALHLGGLTPTLGSLIQTKQNTNLKVICMLRNRGGGFWYDDIQKESMYVEAKLLLENGADGIAFGFLHKDKTIDVEETKKMVEFIHSYGKEAVFHRAIDVTGDIVVAFKQVVDCGVERILTSGGNAKAVEGIKNIKILQKQFGNQVEILAGCGINGENVNYVIENTDINQVHSSCKEFHHDPTASNLGVDFSYTTTNKYDVVDIDKVKEIIKNIK